MVRFTSYFSVSTGYLSCLSHNSRPNRSPKNGSPSSIEDKYLWLLFPLWTPELKDGIRWLASIDRQEANTGLPTAFSHPVSTSLLQGGLPETRLSHAEQEIQDYVLIPIPLTLTHKPILSLP